MTEIYLIRHAQAEGNLYRMMQGHWDGQVTELGRRQIQALAWRFESIPIDAVYASDLSRTRQTAEAITGPQHLPLHTEPALREINMGRWETQFFANLFIDEPEQAGFFVSDPERFYIEGAETFAQVTDRAYAALETIARRHEGQRVAVVSHGVTIRCLLAKITGLGLKATDELPISGNTAVTHLRWEDGRFLPDFINDSHHLAELNLPPWSQTPDLRHEIFDPASDRTWYERCYADAWETVHGSARAFDPSPYFEAAQRHHREAPGAVLKIYNGKELAGLVDLDTRRGAHAGYGWISLLYLTPEYRYQGCGVQLLARAIALYSRQGRRSLRLHVAEGNKAALAFYRRWGFEEIGSENAGASRLLLMEKKLEGPFHG